MDFPEHLKARDDLHYEDLLNEYGGDIGQPRTHENLINCILIISYHLRTAENADELIEKIFDKVARCSQLYNNLADAYPTEEQIMRNENREGQTVFDLMRNFTVKQLRIYGF